MKASPKRRATAIPVDENVYLARRVKQLREIRHSMDLQEPGRLKQRQKARKFLGLPESDSDEIDDVEDVLNEIDIENAAHEAKNVSRSKKTKTTLEAFRNAMRKAQIAQTTLSSYLMVYSLFPVDFQEHIARCDRLLAEPSRPPKRDEYKKHLAVRAARDLLVKKSNLLAEKSNLLHAPPIATTRGGEWCTLAAILYGEEDADLFYICRELKRADRNRV